MAAKIEFILLGLFLSLCVEDSSAQTYKAAVVAFAQEKDSSKYLPSKLLELNRNKSIAQIGDVKRAGVDIVVFPEKAITSSYPDTIEKEIHLDPYSIDVPNPSSDTNFNNIILSGISEAAKSNQVHVVLNVLERQKQDNKPTDYFSTSIVFDAEGKIILKCRKKHLYKELKYSHSNSEDLCTFEANFSGNRKVKFALLFDTDLLHSLKDDTIYNAILTSSLPNSLPFYFGVSLQVGISARNKINLLAAGYTDTDKGYGGTGIYYGNGTSRVILGSELFLIDNVPITQSPKQIRVMAMVGINNLKSVPYTELGIDTLSTHEKTVKQDIGEGSSCNMVVKLDGNNIQPYEWIAEKKNISFLNQNQVISICGLIKPEGKKDQKSLVNSAELEIYIKGDIQQVLPLSVGEKMGGNPDAQYPINFAYEETKTDDVTKISMVLTDPNDLSGFGVVIVNKSGGTLICATHMVLIGSLIFLVFFRSRLFM